MSVYPIDLNLLARLIRFGRKVKLNWTYTIDMIITYPNTILASAYIPPGHKGYIYGFFISCGEANDFYISWVHEGATQELLIQLPGKGTIQYVDFVPLNEISPADEDTYITITNRLSPSGSALYQARILYGIEEV